MTTAAEILIYSSEWCGYCWQAKQLLADKGASFRELVVDGDAALRQEMQSRSGRNTVPQIFVGEVHVGGYDDLAQLEREGRLDALLAGAGKPGTA